MDEDMIPIGRLLRMIPGPLGEIMRELEKKKQAFVDEHGADAYSEHIEELKRKGVAELERQKAEERSRLRIERSGLADSLEEYRFDNFNVTDDWQRSMFDMCMRFIADDSGRWLYISGQPGCGKTHLGTAVCAHYLKAGYPTQYITFQMLAVKLRSNANDDSAYHDILDDYGGVKVLYVDDFFKPKQEEDRFGNKHIAAPTVSDVTHAFELLNMRLVRGGVTVITSERSLDEVIGIDEALGSRIKQRCGPFVLNIARKPDRNHRMNEDVI